MTQNTANWELASKTEKLSRSVPTGIIYSILDDLLYQSLQPFFETKIYKRHLAQILMYAVADRRRKISPIGTNHTESTILKSLLSESSNFDIKIIDRGIMFELANQLLAAIEPISTIEVSLLKNTKGALLARKDLSVLIGCDEDHLYPIYKWSKCYMDLFVKFRDLVVQRYIRLSYHYANKIFFTRSKRIDPTEFFKNLLISTIKAVEKCNPTKGTLTNYVQKHFLNAQFYPEFKHHYSVAYDVPNRTKIDGSNLVIRYDPEVNPEIEANLEPVETPSIIELNLSEFLRSVQGAEIAMIMLGIPFHLGPAEIKRLGGKPID